MRKLNENELKAIHGMGTGEVIESIPQGQGEVIEVNPGGGRLAPGQGEVIEVLPARQGQIKTIFPDAR